MICENLTFEALRVQGPLLTLDCVQQETGNKGDEREVWRYLCDDGGRH